MIRLSDIARAVGVSTTTVSYVLGGSGTLRRISERTRQQIIEAADQLGYSKNALGVQLKKGRSRQIAFLSFQFTREFVFSIYAGLAEIAEQFNYSCRMHHLDHDQDISEDEIRLCYAQILESRPEAIVIHYTLPLVEELVQSCQDLKILLCVVENRSFRGADLLVHSDSADGEIKAVDYLFSRGHRAIGFIHGYHSDDHFSYRDPIRDGFLAGLKKNQLEYHSDWTFFSKQERISVSELDQWLCSLQKSPGRPTAICCCSDYQAIDIMFIALRLGLKVPEDLSIIGYGGLHFTSALLHGITTVHKNYTGIGKLAAEKLLRQLSGGKTTVMAFSVPCHIQEGNTVASLPSQKTLPTVVSTSKQQNQLRRST